jgi:PKD repeat protein
LSKPAPRFVLALAACLLLIALAAPSALAAPDPSYSVSPDPPIQKQAATYTSTSTADPLLAVAKVEWDFDADGVFEVVDETAPFDATHTYSTPGEKTFVMRVTDNLPLLPGVTTENQTVIVDNRPPVADFVFGPNNVDPGEAVFFFPSGSSDPDGDSITYSWAFGDGATSTQANPSHGYATPGTKQVRLRVTDQYGAADDVLKSVQVRDPSAANASFAVDPENPVAGESVTFTSTSTPNGAGQSITDQDWDLDSDGQYDDAKGKTASRVFSDQGVYRVALRVRQTNGNIAVAESTLRVGGLPVATPFTSIGTTPPPTSEQPTTEKPKRAKPSLMSPFPVVRLRGAAYENRTVISLVAIRAPRGALARVQCKGPRCPKAVRRKRSKGKPLRFYTFERPIAAGARLEIAVVGKRRVGKFVRFKMRSAKPPVRTDLCLVPGKRKPRSCQF